MLKKANKININLTNINFFKNINLKEFNIFFWIVLISLLGILIYGIYINDKKTEIKQIKSSLDNIYLIKTIKELTKNLSVFDVDIVSLNLMHPETIEPAMENIDGVFQVAAVYKSWAKKPEEEIINQSIIGGINVLKAEYKAGVKKIIFTSYIYK